MIKKQKSGKAKILYVKDLINLKLKIAIKALVKPQPGQGIWNIFFIKHGICNLMQNKNNNISPP